ncbi:hypothetical protein BDZ91DRAFT_713703 [Kalaharituber pfeilii]|nr:hypothetical protein BDZ91DRAFT_713703 [Kalaharituber pfeilii]
MFVSSKSSIACLLFFIAILASPEPLPFASNQVYIEWSGYAGTGCPYPEAVTLTLRPHGSALAVAFDALFVRVGPGIFERYKNCRIHTRIAHPSGWSFGVLKATYSGYISLDQNVTAIQKNSYWFNESEPVIVESTANWTSTPATDYSFTDFFNQNDMVWSSCASPSPFIMNAQLRLDNSNNSQGSGTLTSDAHDVVLKWRKC